MDRRIDPRTLTAGELVRMYLAHCEEYYVGVDGKPTREHQNFASALNLWFVDEAVGIMPDLPIVQLAKHDLRRLQTNMIRLGRSRTYINATMRRVRSMIEWAIQNDIIEDDEEAIAAKLLGLFLAVPKLKPHRSLAKEPAKIEPVAIAHVISTLRQMRGAARDVVEVILRTGARAQEIASLRAADVRREHDGTWTARPKKHKNAWRGQERVIPLDAACVKIITRRLPRTLFNTVQQDAVLFPSAHGRAFTTNGLRSAIERAIVKARKVNPKMPHWHLHQMRHTAAHVARELASLEDAQALLGHKSRSMTEHYTGNDNQSGARRAQRALSRLVKGVR